MISIAACRKILIEAVVQTPAELLPLLKASGTYLREDIHAPISLPMFDESAVDGYTFSVMDLPQNQIMPVAFEVKAGDINKPVLKGGNCARIFTGAPIPDGADTVFKQEDIEVLEDKIRIPEGHLMEKGKHVRSAAEQCRRGDTILQKSQALNPAAIGLLANLGIEQVLAGSKPKVSIISTGSELKEPGQSIVHGQKYNSNSLLLQAAFQNIGIKAASHHCVDDKEKLQGLISRETDRCDLLLVCGGVSVGNYDYTPLAVEANDFKILFHGVSQKPGKPLLFAQKENKYLFGLPGNPRAVGVAFYLYLKPFVQLIMGAQKVFHPDFRIELGEHYQTTKGRTQFKAALIRNNKAFILSGQDSHMLKSLAEADVLVELDGTLDFFPKGSLLNVYLVGAI